MLPPPNRHEVRTGNRQQLSRLPRRTQILLAWFTTDCRIGFQVVDGCLQIGQLLQFEPIRQYILNK